MGEADIFAQWYREAVYVAGFASTAALIFAGLFWMLARQFKRQAVQNGKLEIAAIRLSENQQILRAYAEMSADWLWELDADLRLKSASDFVTVSDDIGKTPWELADPAMHEERWAAHRAELAARLPFRNFRWERIGSNGERLFISTNGDPIFDRNGVFRGYRGTGRDITGGSCGHRKVVAVKFRSGTGPPALQRCFGQHVAGCLPVRCRQTAGAVKPALCRDLQSTTRVQRAQANHWSRS